ncbi:MAG: hypothetical protein HQK96_20585 [Nitrospirae bacterium]|nr:hypothetical protein [Nitrospirota bacterium]
MLDNHPSAKDTLDAISVGLSDESGVYINLDTLQSYNEELGVKVVADIQSHARGGTLKGKPIFNIVENAKKTLIKCGAKASALQLVETTEILSNECCRALAPHIGHVIYAVTQNYVPKVQYIRKAKKLNKDAG